LFYWLFSLTGTLVSFLVCFPTEPPLAKHYTALFLVLAASWCSAVVDIAEFLLLSCLAPSHTISPPSHHRDCQCLQVLLHDVSPPPLRTASWTRLWQPAKKSELRHAAIWHPGHVPQPFKPSLLQLGCYGLIVSPTLLDILSRDAFLQLLSVGDPKHSPDAPVMKGFKLPHLSS